MSTVRQVLVPLLIHDIVADIDRHLTQRLNSLDQAMCTLEFSLSKVNSAIVLLPGAERLMDSMAHLLRCVHAICISDSSDSSKLEDVDMSSSARLLTISPLISNYADASVQCRIDLERIRDVGPDLAASIQIVLTDCITHLELTHRYTDTMRR
jgi:hypothetical protein